MSYRFPIAGLVCAAALGLAGSAAPLAAAGPAPSADWQLGPMQSGKGCFVARPLGGDVTVAFHYLPKGREFRVLVSRPDWDEWTRRGSQPVPVDLAMTLPGGTRTASSIEGFAMPLTGGVEAIAGVWHGPEGDTVRKRLRAASWITLSSSGTALGSYPLRGSDAAIDALMQCAAGLAKQ